MAKKNNPLQVLLITPPFTQLNTPYPATAYLTGFLKEQGIDCHQADLGLDVTLEIFSREGLKNIFAEKKLEKNWTDNAQRIYNLQSAYINIIDDVIAFLQDKNPSLQYQICSGNYLPMASRFDTIGDIESSFGNMGLRDKARHLASLMLEDLSDYIKECIDDYFGFTRYAERLSRSANSFDELYESIHADATYVDKITIAILKKYIDQYQPKLIGISIPFPGNMYSALRCGFFIKKNYPDIAVAFGGGFVNTELRDISDARILEMTDYICLDDGERPLMDLINYLQSDQKIALLKRSFYSINKQLVYNNESLYSDYPQAKVGTPSYQDLRCDEYISVIDVLNPMHRLWTDGRWNKLTMAHGCYWGKCTFCDISLDYINRYEANSASLLVDRIEILIKETKITGFHFVDEAAPPSLMKEMALELLSRKINITWWTNIRFEKNFTPDLCRLLAASGCVAVSGGLEVASDRILALIDKGVTIEQVSKACMHLTEAGIMVHAYLMYGFPSQTDQETIDSLEVVRQLFENNIIHSGFWHRFAMTAHSPVGMNPAKYKVTPLLQEIHFANNDIEFEDPYGCDAENYSYGLKKSLYNYMQGIGIDEPLSYWFDHEVKQTSIAPDMIFNYLESNNTPELKDHYKLIWIGYPIIKKISKKKNQNFSYLQIYTKQETIEIYPKQDQLDWILDLLTNININTKAAKKIIDIKTEYKTQFNDSFDTFWNSDVARELQHGGLLLIS